MKIWKRPTIAFAAVLARAILAKPSAADAQIARTNAPVNQREGRGTNYAVLAGIPQGARVRILGCTAGYSWCGVSDDGSEGYAAGHYLMLMMLEGVNTGALVTAVGVGVALSIPIWRRDHWRPRRPHRPEWGLPGHRPPGMRQPGHLPPSMKPPGHRPMPKPHGGRLEPKRWSRFRSGHFVAALDETVATLLRRDGAEDGRGLPRSPRRPCPARLGARSPRPLGHGPIRRGLRAVPCLSQRWRLRKSYPVAAMPLEAELLLSTIAWSTENPGCEAGRSRYGTSRMSVIISPDSHDLRVWGWNKAQTTNEPRT